MSIFEGDPSIQETFSLVIFCIAVDVSSSELLKAILYVLTR